MTRKQVALGRDLVRNVLRLDELFRAHTNAGATYVSLQATGSGHTLKRLRNGVQITVGRLDSALLWFSENWPRDLDWPRDIPRPRRTDEVAA